MSLESKRPYIDEAQSTNRLIRQRMSTADPQQLLVRHEMWLQKSEEDNVAQTLGVPSHVLVHYLGDDAFQCMSIPPRPILVWPAEWRTSAGSAPPAFEDADLNLFSADCQCSGRDMTDSFSTGAETAGIQLILGCALQATSTTPLLMYVQDRCQIRSLQIVPLVVPESED